MRKSLRYLLGISLLTSSVAFADVCPDPSTFVWQNNMWTTPDGQYYEVTDYSAPGKTNATIFNYAFYVKSNAGTSGTMVCGYGSTTHGQYIEMIHYPFSIQKPTANNWHAVPPPGWHNNAGLICLDGSAACSFVNG